MPVKEPIHKEELKIDNLIKVIRKNEYLLEGVSGYDIGKLKYDFTRRVVISDNIKFLETIRDEIGGELINDKSIGTFLYLKENEIN